VKHLIDNDTIIKLASYDILQEARSQMIVRSPDLYVLPTARNYIQNNGQFRRTECLDMKLRAVSFIDTCQSMPFVNFADDVLVVDNPKIDPGEKVMLSSCADMQEFEIVTGDSKFIKLLGSHPQAEPIRKRVSGRIVCLEQVIL
jgi:hypothetical protein